MKALVQNTISLFRHGTSLTSLFSESPHESQTNLIISGYSPTLGEDEPCAIDRKHVGILYADVVDYTRLTEQDEVGTHLQLVESMKTMKAHVLANSGRVSHFAGDAILAEFKDAASALHCAKNMQLDVRQWNANLPSKRHVLFRIGVNFGEVIEDNGDIYGNAVNLTARLEKLAYSGGICVSESVRSELEDHPAFNFVALGQQYVKNVREPVQAFWIEIDERQVDDGGFTSSLKVSAMAS